MEFQNDETSPFLDKKTGEVVSISQEEFQAAEENVPLEEFPDWQRHSIGIANEILEADNFVQLPSKWEINEYEIMEKFCLSIADEETRSLLYTEIKGTGAFRRFKSLIHRFNLVDKWYKYRDEVFREIAVEWCKENGIQTEE